MSQVWLRLAGLLNRHPKLSIVILHHFRKDATVDSTWDALRGSSRTGGEVDAGIFMERAKDDKGNLTENVFIRFDGREIKVAAGEEASGKIVLEMLEGGIMRAIKAENEKKKNDKEINQKIRVVNITPTQDRTTWKQRIFDYLKNTIEQAAHTVEIAKFLEAPFTDVFDFVTDAKETLPFFVDTDHLIKLKENYRGQ